MAPRTPRHWELEQGEEQIANCSHYLCLTSAEETSLLAKHSQQHRRAAKIARTLLCVPPDTRKIMPFQKHLPKAQGSNDYVMMAREK